MIKNIKTIWFIVIIALSYLSLNGCGGGNGSHSNLNNSVQFTGTVDFTSGISGAPVYSIQNSASKKYAVNVNAGTVLAFNISTGDSYSAVLNGSDFSISIPAGGYEFFARSLNNKTMRMIKSSVCQTDKSGTINLKSTTVAYMIYNSKVNNGQVKALNEISNLALIQREAETAYDSALIFLKADINDTATASYSQRQTAMLALSIKKSVIEKINGDTDLTCDTTITDADISGKFQTVINEILNNDMSCSITLGVGLQFSAGDSSANVIVLSALYDAVSQTAKEYNLTNNQILVLTAQGNGYSGDQFSIYSASNFETPSLDVYSDAYDFTDDNIIKSYGGKIYIVNRTLSKVLVINGTTMKIEKEYKFAQGSNPHDIAFINSSKAYVTFYNSNIIGIFNPANGAELGTIDISGFDALKDGSAEADQLQIVGSKVFVTLQNISYSGGWATATENAKILVINSATDSVTDTISIHGLTNPYENKDYCEATGKLYFAFTGDWWGSPATGILEVDSSSHQTRVLCLGGSSNEDTIVNGAFTGVKVVSEDTGYCIYAGTWPNYYIGSFNPKTGVFYNKELLTGSFWGDLIKDGANNVYAVNRDSNYTASGLYKIFPNSICNFSGLNRTGSVKKNPIGAALFEN